MGSRLWQELGGWYLVGGEAQQRAADGEAGQEGQEEPRVHPGPDQEEADG